MLKENFNNIDRRLALSYGLVILSLMLVVMVATSWHFQKTLEREQSRLSGLVTSVLADSLSKVGFSGQHRIRLLIDELQEKHQDLVYLRLLDTAGEIIASSPGWQSDPDSSAEHRLFQNALQQPTVQFSRTRLNAQEHVLEVAMAFRGGFDDKLQGVFLLGITQTGTHRAFIQGLTQVVILLLTLLLAGILATHLISQHFARPVRRLVQEHAAGEQRLSYVLDAIDCSVWEWDLTTDAVHLDESWEHIMGHSSAEQQRLRGNSMIQLTHPDDRAADLQRINDHLSGLTGRYISETRALHKNGHWVWVRDNGMVTERDANGTPLKMIGARQDISVRKEVEQAALRESERFKALIKASNTGVWEWDAQSRQLWCGAEYFGMLGYDHQLFSGQTGLSQVWSSLLHPDDLERATQVFSEYLNGDTTGLYQNEFRMRHANGSWVWIISRGRTLLDANGQVSSLTVGAHINVTSLKQAQAELEESQQRLQAISDSIPNSMVYRLEISQDGKNRRFSYISGGVEHLHGISAEQAMADPSLIYNQLLVTPEQMLELETQCITQLSTFRLEAELRHTNGETRWVLLTSSPRRLTNGDTVFDGIEIDISDRKQHEQAIHEFNLVLEKRVQERTVELKTTLENLQRAQEELLQSEKLASLGSLVAGVAHELNTPIGNALMVATSFNFARQQLEEALQSGLTRTALQKFIDEVRDGSHIIERNLARSTELIGSFKQLAVDQTSYQRRPFQLRELVHEILTTLQPTLRKTPFSLHTEVPEDIKLDSYPGPLGQVLINLINNALLHAFIGREQGSIRLSAQLQDDRVRLQICDNGLGISSELQKNIFDPFYTTQLGQGGSGLGLHIVYTLVTGLLGGRIEVQSEPQQGSCFTLDLPHTAPDNHSNEPSTAT